MKSRAFFILLGTAAVAILPARAQNQTPDTSPIVVNGNLPYDITLSIHDMGLADVPTLQSYAFGRVGDDWLIVSGRTNGLHNFSGNGTVNFPPNFQNANVTVIDPVTQQVWIRSLTDVSSGLTQAQVDSLSATNTEYFQSGSSLYVAGGYVYDSVHDNFTTYNTLSAIDLAGAIDWVKTGNGTFAQNFRQTTDPAVQVTGGEMYQINGRTFLAVGQDFEGPYTPGSNGNYTQQVRAFDIVDNGVTLSVTNVTSSAPDPNYRRRDLNIEQIYTSDGGNQTPGAVILSGVFTLGGGAWTVPVEVSDNGTPTMADPNAPDTFKQGMNGYNTSSFSLYDSVTGSSHMILLGGISLEYYDSGNATFVTDNNLPFINQATSIVRDLNGNYTQYLLSDASFPSIAGPDGDLLFGAGSRFFLADGIPTLANGMIDMNSLTNGELLGYVYGGIMADEPNFGNSTASSYIFEVHYNIVPEPAQTGLLLGLGALAILAARRRFASVHRRRRAK